LHQQLIFRCGTLRRFHEELSLIERSYMQYLGLTQALRLSQPKFMERAE